MGLIMNGSKWLGMQQMQMQGKWAGRWIWAAVIQGLIITIVTVFLVDPLSYFNINWYSDPAHVIPGGGGGTWMFTAYILYLVVGVVAVAVTAIFYFYFEGIQGRVYRGLTNYLAWGHYVFMNVGVAAAMLLMFWGGYEAGTCTVKGVACTDEQIHVMYLSQLVNPIGALALLAALGAILGGLGYILRRRMK